MIIIPEEVKESKCLCSIHHFTVSFSKYLLILDTEQGVNVDSLTFEKKKNNNTHHTVAKAM